MHMRHIATVQHHASAIYIFNDLHSPLPYYDLFMAARSALSQPCLQCSMYAGIYSYGKQAKQAPLLVVIT